MINEFKVSKYDSLEEFIAWVDSCPKFGISFSSWSGANSYQEAVDIARMGSDLDRAVSTLKELEHSRKEMTTVMDVTGSVVNMDAYLQGLPENMMEFPIVEEPTKFLNLFIDVSESATTPENELVNKAIAVASIVDDLENNGYRVALTVGMVSTQKKSFIGLPVDYSSCLVAMVKIKDYSQSMSIGQLIGSCHPSFLRVLMFGHINGIYKNIGGPAMGYGRPVNNPADIKTALNEVADKDMVYIPTSNASYIYGCSSRLSSVEGALQFVTHFINLKINS